MKSISAAIVALLVATAQAQAFDLSASRGQKTVSLSKGEVCIIPKNFPLNKEQKPDKRLEEMCAWDFYANPNKIKLEAKGNSTNPAVLVSVYDEEERKFKQEAKLKSSVTCSYTPAILAYFQLSQYLNGAGHVPEVVVRTMNITEHKKMRELGQRTPIASMWASWNKYYREQSPRTFINDKKYIYGALTDIAKNEMFFSEIYGRPSSRTAEARLTAFQGTAIYKGMTSSASLAATMPSRLDVPIVAQGAVTQNEKLRKTVQWTQYVKDLSEMVLLDSILSQQDRFGNQHKKAYIWQINGDAVKKHKVKAAKNSSGKAVGWRIGPDEKKLLEQGAVLVEEMLLKDNDCGVIKANIQLNAGTVEKIRHIDPAVYYRLIKLNQALEAEKNLPAASKQVFSQLFQDRAALHRC